MHLLGRGKRIFVQNVKPLLASVGLLASARWPAASKSPCALHSTAVPRGWSVRNLRLISIRLGSLTDAEGSWSSLPCRAVESDDLLLALENLIGPRALSLVQLQDGSLVLKRRTLDKARRLANPAYKG
jgi:hypothetical protein